MLKQQQQAAAGCGEIAKSRWRFSACGGDPVALQTRAWSEPGGPFDRLPSRSPQPPRWQRGTPRKKPSTPSPVALLPRLRLLLVDGFPARTSTCARVGTGVVGGSACRRRAPGSLSLSLAGARQPARARKYGPRWRQQEGHSGGGRHAPAERARPAPARLVIVDRRSQRLGGAGGRRSCGLLHGLSASRLAELKCNAQVASPLLKFSRGVCK